MTFLFGKAWREQYTLDLINDPVVSALAAKVEVSADTELEKLYDEKWPAIVEVETVGGRIFEARRDIPKGEPEYPVSDAELRQKFMSLAEDAVTKEQADEIWRMIFDPGEPQGSFGPHLGIEIRSHPGGRRLGRSENMAG